MRFTCCGKEVLLDGKHYADGKHDKAALHITLVLNADFERNKEIIRADRVHRHQTEGPLRDFLDGSSLGREGPAEERRVQKDTRRGQRDLPASL